jgi:hypothetical protein
MGPSTFVCHISHGIAATVTLNAIIASALSLIAMLASLSVV